MKKLLAHIIIFWIPSRFHTVMIPAREQRVVYGYNPPLKNCVRERKIVSWAWKVLLPKTTIGKSFIIGK